MEISKTTDGDTLIEKAFNPIVMVTEEGEVMAICMRDTGFEFMYQGSWYSAKNGKVSPMLPKEDIKPNRAINT